MLHASQPHSAHTITPRPRKRRRTATQVLAGYFDSPNISRDFFADMANTDETIRAVNSIIARNQSLLIDSRFQHIGSFKTQPPSASASSSSSLSSSHHRHHQHPRSSLAMTRLSEDDAPQNSIQSPPDRRSKLMGRIQDISHLLLSHYDTEFAKETPFSSPNQQNPPPPPQTSCPDAQPTAPCSPPVFSPRQADESPRQPVSPALGPDSRQRSPSIINTEEEEGGGVSERPPSRSEATMVVTNLPQGRRASFTASPPTPTRSITSLASHASSKWPHTPDNELGPSFAEISESYADDYAASSSYPSHHHHHSSNINNAELTIVQLQTAASAWHQQQQASPAIPTITSPKLKSSTVSVTESTQQHWMMMTQIRDGVAEKRSDLAVDANANNAINAMGVAVSEQRQQRPSSVARSFSLDNILSPVPSVPGSPVGKMSVGAGTPPRAVTVDGDDVDVEMEMDVEMEDVISPPTTTTATTTATPPPTTTVAAIPTAIAVANDDASTAAPSVQPEDIQIPFVATPEREMSIGTDPLQPRSRRRSTAMKIVESEEETEKEKEKEKYVRRRPVHIARKSIGSFGSFRYPLKTKKSIGSWGHSPKVMKIVESESEEESEGESEEESEGESEREREREKEKGKHVRRPVHHIARKSIGIGWEYSLTEGLRRCPPPKKHPKLTIKIKPLMSPSSSAAAAASSSLAFTRSSLSSVTVAEVSEEKEKEGQGQILGKDASFTLGARKLTSLSAPVPGLVPLATSSSLASASASEVPLTPSELQDPLLMMSGDVTSLPPLIPGKARKRKAPPARKGWKGWVEVEVDESQSQKPVKGFSLDDLPLGERRTRSGKQFDS